MAKPELGVVDARFLASVGAPADFAVGAPEVAFCGRSNVGKSSLLNALCGRRALARTSKTPGRTQRANLFDVKMSNGTEVRLVDLPGYGHANAPRHIRDRFGPLIEGWLVGSTRLTLVVLLIDCRREPEQAAMNFLLWLEQHNLNAMVVFTKTDKLPRNRRDNALRKLAAAYHLKGTPHASSASTGDGIGRLRSLVARAARQADDG